MDKREEPDKQEAINSSNREYLEYTLKGVQAFAVGVALLGASLAVANVILPVATGGGLMWVNIALSIFLMFITIAISVFGCLGVLVGFSILGIWRPKGNVPIVTWGINVAWLIFLYAFVTGLFAV